MIFSRNGTVSKILLILFLFSSKGLAQLPKFFNIGIIKNTTQVTDSDIKNWIEGLQIQIGRDYSPIYGNWSRILNLTNAQYKPDFFPLIIDDDSDVPGALGYHDIDAKGIPYIRIFINDIRAANNYVSLVMSHEILELLSDPFITSVVLDDTGDGTGTTGTIYSAEICDPVEADTYQVTTNEGVPVVVSNFILPYWFVSAPPAGVKYFDFLHKLPGPLTITAGGYFGYRQITNQGLQPWQRNNSLFHKSYKRY